MMKTMTAIVLALSGLTGWLFSSTYQEEVPTSPTPLKTISASSLFQSVDAMNKKNAPRIMALNDAIAQLKAAAKAEESSSVIKDVLNEKVIALSQELESLSRFNVSADGEKLTARRTPRVPALPPALPPAPRFGLMSSRSSMFGKLNNLAKQYKDANEEKRDELADEIRQQLVDAYQKRLQVNQERLEIMRTKLVQLEEQLNAQTNAQEEMVELRLELILKQAELGDLTETSSDNYFWTPVPPTRPTLSRLSGMAIINAPSNPALPGLASNIVSDNSHPSFPTPPLLPGKQVGVIPEVDPNQVVFIANESLENGKLLVRGIGDKKNSHTINFDVAVDFVAMKLRPGKYEYDYEQKDGKVKGKGKFEKSEGLLVFEIETGEPQKADALKFRFQRDN